ncbi:hypothetical protein AZE42_11202 [Rhizopogon vesiculosus]|uniref:Uncharacterized protein n=1 Tax=Rhizopogon vesiculosus TaxID=180088 RepID=A0A1J8QQM8_9AGAM|nr:hypothetical protein AZE42_11202 [Rhizopogon vesiculosus]
MIAHKQVAPWQADRIGKKDIVLNMLSSLKTLSSLLLKCNVHSSTS